MSLLIKEKEPWYVLPFSRYELSLYQPANVQNTKSYTVLLCSKIFTEEGDRTISIMMRPGLHFGLAYDRQGDILKLEGWFLKNGAPEYKRIWLLPHEKEKYGISGSYGDKFYSYLWTDDIDKKIMKFYINYKLVGEIDYSDTDGKCDYTETPYGFGTANVSPVAFPNNYFGTIEYENAGLFDCIIPEHKFHYLSDIDIHIKQSHKHGLNIFDELYPYKKNCVFYYDFKNQTPYKIWDVSENSNYLTKLIDIEEEKFNFFKQ
jgi:hypothetical protein